MALTFLSKQVRGVWAVVIGLSSQPTWSGIRIVDVVRHECRHAPSCCIQRATLSRIFAGGPDDGFEHRAVGGVLEGMGTFVIARWREGRSMFSGYQTELA